MRRSLLKLSSHLPSVPYRALSSRVSHVPGFGAKTQRYQNTSAHYINLYHFNTRFYLSFSIGCKPPSFSFAFLPPPHTHRPIPRSPLIFHYAQNFSIFLYIKCYLLLCILTTFTLKCPQQHCPSTLFCYSTQSKKRKKKHYGIFNPSQICESQTLFLLVDLFLW